MALSAKELAEELSNFVNGAGSSEFTEFALHVTHNTHRTLQQQEMRLFLIVIAHWAGLVDGLYDLRNEATVKLAKRICATFDKYDRALPLI